MRLIIAILLMMISSFSYAEIEDNRLDILLGQWSDHVRHKPYYNEKHDLLGLEYKDVVIAKFINSDGDKTKLLGYSPEYFESKYLDFKVTYALINGYENQQNFFIPIPSVTLKAGSFPVQIDVNYIIDTVWTVGFRLDL